jgi:hypothetical protein
MKEHSKKYDDHVKSQVDMIQGIENGNNATWVRICQFDFDLVLGNV